jgi:phosphatidylserine decarboxylase
MSGPSLLDHLRAWPQFLLPQHLLSRMVYMAARSRRPWLRDRLLAWFLGRFDVNLEEAEREAPEHYDCFNDFFTRALKAGSRPVHKAALVSPVDGTVSQTGPVRAGQLFQAKGRHYTVEELLGSAADASPFRDGHFCTLYLAPHNYHRIHMPADGELTGLVHLPGRLFSVNAATTRVVPRLFARNERVAAIFDTGFGPMAVVMVGALLVGSIETVWTGEITPPTRLGPRHLPLPPKAERLRKAGDEIGRFNMGSTVILLLPPGAPVPGGHLQAGAELRFGQVLSH